MRSAIAPDYDISLISIVSSFIADDVRVTIAATLDSISSPSSNVVSPGLVAWYAEGFADPLGDRLLLFDNAGPALELLRFRAELASQPGFEMAVRRRIDQLADFRHPAFARVRSLTMLDDQKPQLALVSELVRGERLSTLLRAADRAGLRPDPGSAVWLIRRLLPAVGALHDAGGGLPHGTICPDRILVTPDRDLRITEYPLGGAIEQLGLSAANLWQTFGVAGREHRGRTSLDQRTDVAQVALAALAVLLGRPLRPHEIPIRLSTVDEALNAWQSSKALRSWLARALFRPTEASRRRGRRWRRWTKSSRAWTAHGRRASCRMRRPWDRLRARGSRGCRPRAR